MKFKKTAKTKYKFLKLILFLIAFLVIIFSSLVYWAYKSETNSFPNRLWQYSFWRFPIVERLFLTFPKARQIMDFSYAGDAKYDYLNNLIYDKILIEIDYFYKFQSSKELTPSFQEITKSILPNKEISVKIDQEITSELPSNDTNPQVFSTLQTTPSNPKTKVLHVVILPQKYLDKNYGGLSIDSDTIVLYYSEKFSQIEEYHLESSYAHELGHLLGLKHFPQEECVMYPSRLGTDSGLARWILESSTETELREFYPIEYCETEKSKIENTRKFRLVNLERFNKYPGSYYYLDEILP